MALTDAQARKRIRYLVALEVRQRVAEVPGHCEVEPPEVIAAWMEETWDIAEKIWPENRKPPGGYSNVDPYAPKDPHHDR